MKGKMIKERRTKERHKGDIVTGKRGEIEGRKGRMIDKEEIKEVRRGQE